MSESNGVIRPSRQHLTNVTEYKHYTVSNFETIPQVKRLPKDIIFGIKVVAQVFPFKVNQYVVDELIDWNNVPEDPIFRLTFPQKEMLRPHHFSQVAKLLESGDRDELQRVVNEIRLSLNPHPAMQMQLNVPQFEGTTLQGVQHKYRETTLFFPTSGQTCHAYCTFCFRWPQFVGMDELKFASREADRFAAYLKTQPNVTDVIFTGGDPMVMKSKVFRRYLEPLLDPELEHVQNIRIGTKSLAYWPQKYVVEDDADDVLRMLEELVNAGKHVAIMAHSSHYRELETPIAQEAIRRVRDTGAEIRTQSPLLRHINDSSEVWQKMWRLQVRLGMVPYYMFVERDTGPAHYFEVPLAEGVEIYANAIRHVSGLARTARGPSMSATPGKIEIQGVAEIAGEKVFVLRMLQARNPNWAYRPFFAKFDPNATWFDDLKPAFGEKEFFFEAEMRAMQEAALSAASS